MTSFKSALRHNMTYIMDIMNKEDFDTYCEKGGISEKLKDMVAKRLNKIGSYTVTNGKNGNTYIAKALPHMLRIQA